jgi:NADPH-dependent ferric siderophore reductase
MPFGFDLRGCVQQIEVRGLEGTQMNISQLSHDQPVAPQIQRIRHELKLRSLQVESVDRLTPGMLRITFSGEDLAGFISLAHDDHIKIFIPAASGEIERRDYTPRRYDPLARRLVIDFAIHDAGPATRWALSAKQGDALQIGGPKGSTVVSSDVKRWLLIGDETALPAIGRRIEEASSGTHLASIVAVTGPDEHQTFSPSAMLSAFWAHRQLSAAADPTALLSVLETVELLPGTFVWVAAEASVARAIRTYLIRERGHSLNWMKAGGYWIMGKADAHEKMDQTEV